MERELEGLLVESEILREGLAEGSTRTRQGEIGRQVDATNTRLNELMADIANAQPRPPYFSKA